MQLESLINHYINGDDFSEYTERKGSKVSIEGIAPSAFSFIISSIHTHDPVQTLVITGNSQKMNEISLDLGCFINPDLIYLLPPWETLPYEFVSPSEKIERERITALYKILSGDPAIVVATPESLIRRVPHKEFLLNKGIHLSTGEDYSFDDLIESLHLFGYSREARVESYGQFSIKGGILDVYLPTSDNPMRLDFFGDRLDSIREFDPDSQISYALHETVTIYPRKELVLLPGEREKLVRSLKAEMKKDKEGPPLPGEPDDGSIHHTMEIPGVEDLFPLIIEPDTVLSYFSGNRRIFFLDTLELISQKDAILRTFRELYDRKSSTTVCLNPEILIDESIFDIVHNEAIDLQVFTSSQNAIKWSFKSIPNYQGRIKQIRSELSDRINVGWKVFICTGFEGQARRLYDLFSELDPTSNFESIDPDRTVNILISPLKEGFEIASDKTIIITDHEIFGKSYRKKKQFKKKYSRPIESFLDLKENDYIVHINHGIGVFKGIERMSAGGVERDFLLVEYTDHDKLYVSLDQITMVQKYIGMDGKTPRIDGLGKKSSWNRIKERVKKSVEEIARELMEIYSKRRALKGYQFPPDTTWQEEFESKFEFDETPDQITAIEDIKDDMENPGPMDRLVCGDVGFGKTEVAIRAAFKAVMAGKQVALLVPTTVLAMQHFSTFQKRFYDYPISIEMLSRFKTRKETINIKEKLSKGEIDIVIGTHALLAKDIIFKNLGLLIIDEEQRFGVKHKEQLKKLRALVDVLTLSATPIPRTLHMSLTGIRDLTLISTPPENRQSIETYVLEENPDIVRMAIIREIERNGQIFFVHNRVQTIEAQETMLRDLVPEASFCIAHGQMKEHELEEVVIEFLNKKFDVLISTTIIESGLDMPNVNTIIINRADTFGLSQLYQLKGRVGRSITKAYAYLMYPRHIPLNETAQKRLQVIAEYADLGSGFKIAMKDMEIRGSGNILGMEQSGNIMDVGFDLYCQMLEDAVRKIKGERPVQSFRTPVFLKTDFYIPESYISDERQKIEFYKRFESCESESEVEELEKELEDRFGPPPAEVRILVELEKIRTIASTVLIDEVIEESKRIRIHISANSTVNREKVVTFLKNDNRISLDLSDNEILYLKPVAKDNEKKLIELKKWLQQIS